MRSMRWCALGMVLSGCAAFGAFAQVAEKAGPNLVPGGDFEGDALSKHWKWNDNKGAFAVQAAPGRNGGQAAALKSTGTSDRGKFYVTGLTVPAGTALRVSLWAKCENLQGGTWVNYEGPASEGGSAKFDLAGGSSDWTYYEHRWIAKGKNAAPGTPLKLEIWFYVYGRGTLTLDEIECRAIEPDVEGAAKHAAAQAQALAKTVSAATAPKPAKLEALAAAVKGPADLDALVRAWASAQSGTEAFGVLATDGGRRVARELPFDGPAAAQIELNAARHEFEGAQALIFARDAVKEVAVSASALQGPGPFAAENLTLHPVAYLPATRERPWFEGPDEKWWADPLPPNKPFTVQAGTIQPVYLRVYVPPETKPGLYQGELLVKAAGHTAKLPIRLTVYAATLPKRLTLKTMCVAGKHEQPYQDLALQQRLGIGNIAAGMSWTKPTLPAKGESFDFSAAEAKLTYAIDRGLNAFILASTPKPGKWGFPKEFTPEWKAHLTKVLREYGAFVKRKGWLEMAYFNNIDEPANNMVPQVKEVYGVAKAANPDVKVFSCLNMVGTLDALKEHADTMDVYIQQSDQQQAPAWQARGKELWWALCIWPRERPNVFLHYPLVDARIAGWLCRVYNVDGFEYWQLTSWPKDAPKDGSWVRNAEGAMLAAWKDENPQLPGDGYLVYPGDDGQPVNSLRFECLRDGLEDHELLTQLKAKLGALSGDAKAEAERLVRGEGLVTNMFIYTQDPAELNRARRRVLELLASLPK